jgi:8-oxo-dGTP pyrophosphatase MutT (NUDIX family)
VPDPRAFSQPPPIPGAAVLLLRDGSDGLEVLMIERVATIAYGGMWAFPGGRVEAADTDPARPDDLVAQARRAAARETEEEVGLRVDPAALAPHSHWTGGDRGRRFAAWYFMAGAPTGEVVVDARECAAYRWVRPADALVDRDRGEMPLVAPTWMTLHGLAAARTVAEAHSQAAARPPVVYLSRVADHGDDRVVMWAGDAGYEDGDPGRAGPRHRLVMAGTGWRFESS